VSGIEGSTGSARRVIDVRSLEWRQILDSVADGILLITADGMIVDCNAAAERMYGYSRDDFIGRSVLHLRLEADRDLAAEQLGKAVSSSALFQTVHVRANGDTFPVEVSSRGLEFGGGPGVVSVVRDVSERLRRQEEREALLAEATEANRRLGGVLRIASGALGTLDPDELLDTTLEILRQEVGSDIATFLELRGDDFAVAASAGTARWAPQGFRVQRSSGFAGRVAEATAPVCMKNVESADLELGPHAPDVIGTMFGVPLLLGGELFGVLELAWATAHAVTDTESGMVQLAADRMMLGIANAQLYERSRRAEELSAVLNRVNAIVNSSFDSTSTMCDALGVVSEALACDVVVIGDDRDGSWLARHAADPACVGCRVELAERMDFESAETATLQTAHLVVPLQRAFDVAEGVVVPISVRGERLGDLFAGRSDDGGFDELAVEYLLRIADTIGLALANVADFENEHRIAETLQEAILTTPASVRGIDFAHLYRSATVRARVGGDFYDVFELAHSRVGVVVGDVSGKGLEAAVLTSVIKDTVRAYAHETASPAEVISRANLALGLAGRQPDFATVFFGILDVRAHELVYCSAGHPPAAVVGADGVVRFLECTSPVIGAFADLPFTDAKVALTEHDTVFAYTDGATEARARDGEFFGEDRLGAALAATAGREVASYPAAVFDAVMAFCDGRLTDDIALVAFRLARGGRS
jgi:phosphoserine phosphatase RsbU/P